MSKPTGGTYTFRGRTYNWNEPPEGFIEVGTAADGYPVYVGDYEEEVRQAKQDLERALSRARNRDSLPKENDDRE